MASVAAAAVVLVAAMVFLATRSGGENAPATPADPDLVQAVTSVAAGVFDTVGAGSASNPPTAISGSPLTEGGKPEVLYVGGEFCPYCAAERWAMVLAFSRFGTFSDLQVTKSAAQDVFPNTNTFSFYGSSYQSDYVSFVPVEAYSNKRSGNGYAKLQSLTAEQQDIVDSYSTGIPFIDFGGAYVLRTVSFSPEVINGMSWQDIASSLTRTDTEQSQAIVGSANMLSAAICRITNGQPQEVCGSAGVQAGGELLP